MEKRRLKLMPEVLPAPDRARPGGARQRTVAHMQRMAQAAAAVASASCSREPTNTQTVVIPPTTSTSTATTTAVATAPTVTATATATPTAPPTVTAPPTGYAVVDPMPAPARCAGLARTTKTIAAWKKDATGTFLEITVTLPTGGTFAAQFDKATPPSVWGSNLLVS